jgi:hypothetical protein
MFYPKIPVKARNYRPAVRSALLFLQAWLKYPMSPEQLKHKRAVILPKPVSLCK